MTRPLDVASSYLIIAIVFLAAWWVILRRSEPQPKRLFYLLASLLLLGFALAALPTLMLVWGSIWPSLVIVLQLASIGGALIGAVLFGTLAVLVWRLIAAVIDRL